VAQPSGCALLSWHAQRTPSEVGATPVPVHTNMKLTEFSCVPERHSALP